MSESESISERAWNAAERIKYGQQLRSTFSINEIAVIIARALAEQRESDAKLLCPQCKWSIRNQRGQQ